VPRGQRGGSLRPYSRLSGPERYFFFQVAPQSLTEISIENIKKIIFLGSKVRSVLEADNLTAVYALIVYTSAVQRSYVLGHNSLMPMEMRAPPHYYYYYYYYYYY
jgi:hypothetical protein